MVTLNCFSLSTSRDRSVNCNCCQNEMEARKVSSRADLKRIVGRREQDAGAREAIPGDDQVRGSERQREREYAREKTSKDH